MTTTKTEDKTEQKPQPPTNVAPLVTTTKAPLAVQDIDDVLDERPEGERGKAGLEGINRRNMLIPRLALAQSNSPEVTEGDPAYVEGLRPGDLFNSVTKQKYGRDVRVQVVRQDKERAVEFRPIDEGGGVLDPDVPLNDARMKWGENGEKPTATLFMDFLAILVPDEATGIGRLLEDRLIALSFKSTGIKVAKQLNGLIALRNDDIYAGVYRITTDTKLKPQPHKIYKVQNAGWAGPKSKELGRETYLAVKDLDAGTIDRDANPNDDPDAFVPAAFEDGGSGTPQM